MPYFGEWMLNVNNETLLMVFVACTGAAVLLQSLVLLALFLTIRKTTKSVQNQIEHLSATVLPVVEESRAFLKSVAPRIEAAAEDLAVMTQSLRAQGHDLQKATNEVLERVRKQSARVDAIVSKVLDGMDQAGTIVSRTVTKPVRQLQGIVASAKAAISVLRSAPPTQAATHSPADQDLFV
jgi:uncharacterized protein YoxC